MDRRFVIAVIGVVALLGLFALFAYDGWDGRGHTEVGQVVTTSTGETLVVYDNDRRGFFPFGFFLFPLFWIFVIGGLFALFRRGPWRGYGPNAAWLDDWHRRAHETVGTESANAAEQEEPR